MAKTGADQLICVFVFAYAKSRFSHDAARLKDGPKMDDVIMNKSLIRNRYVKTKIYFTSQKAHSVNLSSIVYAREA